MRARRGFTLIELLVSVSILGVIMVYLFGTFGVQQKTYTVVDQLTEIQQNGRAVSELLERDLRHAGMLVPESGAVCGIDNANGPDVLFVSDADAIEPGAEKVADFGADLPAATTNLVGPGSATVSLDGLVAEPSPPTRAAYDTDGDSVTDSDFRRGGGVIVTDLANPERGAACGVVSAVDPGGPSITVNVLTAGLAATANPVDLVAVPAHVYQVNAQLQLLRNGQVLAENVEDFQVAYFIDANGNGLVDATEFRGDGVSPNYMANAVNGADVREVRANLVLRTKLPDGENTEGQFQVTENRTPPGGSDGYRRRAHSARVRLRNVGSRS